MKKQFGKISLKKTYTKNMSVKKYILVCRDFTPFNCKNETSASTTTDEAKTKSTTKEHFI